MWGGGWGSQDELRPLTCGGQDSQGGMAMTLIDALDSLVVFGELAALRQGVAWLQQHLSLDINARVHVFELTIRALGVCAATLKGRGGERVHQLACLLRLN